MTDHNETTCLIADLRMRAEQRVRELRAGAGTAHRRRDADLIRDLLAALTRRVIDVDGARVLSMPTAKDVARTDDERAVLCMFRQIVDLGFAAPILQSIQRAVNAGLVPRTPRRNIGKPVVDVGGDDRPGA